MKPTRDEAAGKRRSPSVSSFGHCRLIANSSKKPAVSGSQTGAGH